MWDWRNSVTTQGIPYSRYVASFANIASRKKVGITYPIVRDWALCIGLSDSEANDIADMATNGKMELETTVTMYFNTNRFRELYQELSE